MSLIPTTTTDAFFPAFCYSTTDKYRVVLEVLSKPINGLVTVRNCNGLTWCVPVSGVTYCNEYGGSGWGLAMSFYSELIGFAQPSTGFRHHPFNVMEIWGMSEAYSDRRR
jgi:hypothetical protein